MKHKELSNTYNSSFCMELSMLLQAGITPYESAFILYESEPDKDGKNILRGLVDNLEKGMLLSAALRESGYFPQYLVKMTEVGEKTGHLAETLKSLSGYYDRKERLSIAVKNAVIYPALLFIVMLVVVLLLIIRVLPIFNEVFNRLGIQMSPIAVWFMRFGGWLLNTSGIIAAIFGAFVIIAFAVRAVPSARSCALKKVNEIFGDYGVFRKVSSARFVFVMQLAVTSGIDPENATELAAAVSGGTKAVDKRHEKCVNLISAGSPFSEAMLQSGILSVRNSRILSVGERSGSTDTALAEIAERCEREAQKEMDRLVGIIEPALVIAASVMVGIILLSVMLPLMNIMAFLG